LTQTFICGPNEILSESLMDWFQRSPIAKNLHYLYDKI